MCTGSDHILSPCHCAVLRKASRHVSHAYDVVLSPTGLKTTQFSLLAAIRSNGEEALTMGELAEIMVMDRSTLGHNLRPLRREGYLVIETGVSDSRSRTVRLTEKGERKLRQVAVLWNEMQARFEAAFGLRATGELRAALLRLATTDFSPAL